MGIRESILNRINKKLVVLLDPEKTTAHLLTNTCRHIANSTVDYVFIGGSGCTINTDEYIQTVRRLTNKPIILFPGDISQFSSNADALLFLSLLSGRNADLLIGQHVKVAKQVKESGIVSIPTGYILIDGGKESATERVSNTHALKHSDDILSTAIAAQLLGKQIIYLEAGSGAINPVSTHIISIVSTQVNIPIIVGGGIRTPQQMCQAYSAGADIVVIGNHFENHHEEICLFCKEKDHYNANNGHLNP